MSVYFDPNLPSVLSAIPSGETEQVHCSVEAAGAVHVLAVAAGVEVSGAELHAGTTMTLTLARA